MNNKTAFFILLFLVLVSCSAPATPAPTTDIPPSATATIIPLTETLTPTAIVIPTPAESVILSESELFNESYRTGELSTEILPGVTASTEIVTDQSGCPVVCRVEINPSWNDAENAIPRFTWKLLFEVGKHTGGAEGSGFAKDVDADVYAKMVAEAKAGNLDWSQVGIGLKQIYLAGSETPQDVTIVPMSGEAALPEGMRAVNKVVWVRGGNFINKYRMTQTNSGKGSAMGLLSGETLYLYIGFDDSVPKDVKTQSDVLIEQMSQVAEVLYLGDGTPSANYDLAGMLRKKSGWAAVTIVDSQGNMGDTEKITNHP